jgi:hypothetical protein
MARTDWIPHLREDQLILSRLWQNVITTSKASAWGIPAAEMTALKNLTTAADAALLANQPRVRNSVTVTQCNAAFTELVGKMRFLKNHYFLLPPLTNTDIASLGLKPHDTRPTPIPAPTAQAEADIDILGIHLLLLHLHAVPGSPPDPHHSDYGYRIFWGIFAAGVVGLTPGKWELTAPPLSGEDLPHSRFTRRQKELFDFPAEDSGKTVYFCVRFENAKGEPGPWGPIFHALIP